MITILKKKKEMENMTFLINNIGTILTGAVLLIIVASGIRNREKAAAEVPAGAVPTHVPAMEA